MKLLGSIIRDSRKASYCHDTHFIIQICSRASFFSFHLATVPPGFYFPFCKSPYSYTTPPASKPPLVFLFVSLRYFPFLSSLCFPFPFKYTLHCQPTCLPYKAVACSPVLEPRVFLYPQPPL